MPKILDDCVEALRSKGVPEKSAFPICRSRLKLSEEIKPEEIEKLAEDFKAREFQEEPELKEMRDIEIFAVGVWNGEQFTEKDLDDIVNAFQATKEKIHPFLKIGHSDKQTLLARDEMPSAGLVSNIRRMGKKLLADFVDVPKKIFDIVKRRAFNKISSELFVNINIGGIRHPLALKAVALLGGETPAVHDLNSILDLFTSGGATVVYNNKNETKEFQFDSNSFKHLEEHKMDNLEKENAKLELEVKKYEQENGKISREFESAKVSLETSKKEAKEFKEKYESEVKIRKENEVKAREEKIGLSLDQAVKDGKINPAQKENYFALLKSVPMDETKKFSIKDKTYNSVEELVFSIIDAEKPEINLEEKSTNDKIKKDDDAMVQKAQEYAEKNKVSYKEALIEVSG